MEVLMEFNGNKIPLHLPSQSVLLDVVQKEANKYDSSALVTYGEDLSANYLLQKWSTKWECYVTIHGHDGVCDGDRLLLSIRPNMMKSSTSKAIEVCKVLKKPSEEHRKILNQLYPSCGRKSRIPDVKKSMTTGKSRSIATVFLRKTACLVPRGKLRKKLHDEGRIKTIPFRRSMTSFQVRKAISSTFTLDHFKFMKTSKTNYLEDEANQELNGDEVVELAGSGSLYIMESEDKNLEKDRSKQNHSEPDLEITKYEAPVKGKSDIFIAAEVESQDDEVFIEEVPYPSITEENNDDIKSNRDDEFLSDIETESHVYEPIINEVATSSRQVLVESQDNAYLDSLKSDREKDELREANAVNDEVNQYWRESLASRYEESVGNFSLAFRMAGSRLVHGFESSTPLKDLYGFVFVNGKVDPPFTLFTHPHKEVPVSSCSLDESEISCGSTVFVEYCGSFDPSKAFGLPSTVSTSTDTASNFHSLLKTAQTERENYMSSLQLHYGCNYVSRSTLYEDVLQLYRSGTILLQYPCRFRFKGEKAIDTGGVGRDLYSAFYDAVYRNFFEGSSFVTPAVHPGINMDDIALIGTIISHCYLVTGILPVRIAFPCLAAILLHNFHDGLIPDNVLVESFIDTFSHHDAQVYKRALIQINEKYESFSDDVKSALTHIFSFYGCREIPSPTNLEKLTRQIARYEFIVKPAAMLQCLSSGIPESHKSFWRKMPHSQLYSVYNSMCISVEKVLAFIDSGSNPCTPAEERVLMYLRQYVGNKRDLRQFMRFTTGSSVCTGKGLTVTFNHLEGYARRPISHACACMLELPVTYATYSDFEEEMDNILNNDDSFLMDSL